MARKILIVDDIASNRLVLKEMLKKDYSILEAKSGEEALDILAAKHENISAVLLDISMPGLDGFEVLDRIRADKQLSSMPVIMITGIDDKETRIKSLALGANDFVMKPYSSEILKHCLRNNIAFHEAAATASAMQRDVLTGLYNREAFFEKAREMVSAHEPGHYIMACFDIDKFKIINDQYGMQKGDEVLMHTAEVFRAGFEPHGGICCRVSADNFAVLYPADFKDTAEIAAIREKASRVEGLVSPVLFCIGRFVVDDVSMPPATMYDRAILAAASVKGRYDERVALYNDAMRERLMREQVIVSEMADALADRQFEVWYQPQYNHSSDAMIGAEALVRWRHPQKGMIPPNDFINIFEQNGFIYALDKYVWEEVCHSLRKWIDAGRLPLPVSVNISRYDILRPDVVGVLAGLVEKYGLPIDLLRLEITESAFSESSQHIVEVVKELIDCGFTVEIDDFGSGYSSLNTLKDVPAQILKLDMKFLESSDDSQRGGNIVESIVRMAKWLGMSVIAEGVETLEQANYLRSIGCYYMQGYLYARPMPADKYAEHCSGSSREEHLLTLETVENLDNNAFWDPKSIDTLIFNSYIGGACIFEYHNGKIELLRATEKYAQVIGSAGMTVEDALKLDWADHLDEEYSKRVIRDLEESIATKKEVTGEYIFLDLPNCPHETYLRSTMRVIASAGERYLVYCTNENVTAQRQAERNLREAAEQMQTLMDDTPGGFARMRLHPDGTGCTEYVNDGFCKMRGMTQEELLTAYSSDLMLGVHPDDYDTVSAEIAKAIATNGLMNTKYRLQNKAGDYVWMQVFARFVKAENGDTIINCYYADLSEMEKRQLSLRETMPFILSAIMESSENLDFAKDKDFNYLCCSPAFVRFTRQKSEADVIGKTDYDFWTKEEADHFRSDDIRLFEGGESLINFVEPIPSDDDVQHYSVTSKYIIRDSSGEIIGLYGSGRDVTDTRAALDRLQLLTDSIPGGLATYAIAPDSMKITYFNDGFCNIFGCSREEYIACAAQNGVVSLVFPEDLPGIMEQLQKLMADGSPIDCTYRSYKLDGSGYMWLNLRGVLAERHDETAFVNAVLYDITAQREAQLRSRNLAEQLSSIMDNVNCGIAAFVMDGDEFRKYFVNDKYYDIIGYSREQFEAEVGSVFDIVYPEDKQRVFETAVKAYEPGVSADVEYRVIHRNGALAWVKTAISTRAFEGIERPVQVSVFTDITAEKLAEQELKSAAAQIQSMMDDMPGGFIRMSIAPDGSQKPVYINTGFAKLMGFTREEAMAASAGDMHMSVHPDDADTVKAANEAVAEMLETGEMRRTRYRLRRGDGSYIWLSVLGRVTRDASGNAFLNVYYTDASEQVREEETQKSLLDNLPGGAGLYSYRDKQLSIVYLNKSYWELVGRKAGNLSDTSATAAVHPDDLGIVAQELAAAVEQKRDLACDIRMRHETDGYFTVHLSGHVTQADDGHYLIYTVFIPVLKDNVTYQQMLPVVLSAMMESTTDLTFAKDTSFRYLSCSRGFAKMAGQRSEREVIGKTDYELFEAAMADKYRRDDEALLASGEAIIDRMEAIPSGDDKQHYSSTSKYILRDGSGEVIGLYGVGRDITQAMAQDTQFQLINDALPGGIATYSFRNDALRVVYCNDGFCRLFGGTREGMEKRGDLDPLDWVFAEDRAALMALVKALVMDGTPFDSVYRVHVIGGGYKWINEKASLAERRGDTVLFNAILLDVTERQNYNEQLRISEEENSLATRLGGSIIARFSVADRTISLQEDVAAMYSLPVTIGNVPDGPIRLGLVAPESARVYTAFFEAIIDGNKAASAVFQQKYLGEWRWMEAKSSLIYDDDGRALKAIISFNDVTEKVEREAIYKKWQQSLQDRRPETYTMYRCNISKNSGFDTTEGSLLTIDFAEGSFDFDDRTAEYVQECVFEDDSERFFAFLNVDALLADFYRGNRVLTIEYREKQEEDSVRWLRLTVDLVDSPYTSDVDAYMLFEDIDEAKRRELQMKELSETDPLTGILNRSAFTEKVNKILRASKQGTSHALLMLDVDNFKQVNDVFGHAAGDQALIDIADGLRSIMRRDDLVARLGGDEFVVFLGNVFDRQAAATKAKQICALVRKSFSLEVRISASVGITITPRDGRDFDSLYKKADAALYYVKGSGRDSYAFYSGEMTEEHLVPEPDVITADRGRKAEKKRRMLIVDDNVIDHALLQNIFKDEFIVEKAKDGSSALVRLRHYGSAISVVLLDLMMPGMDGFAVLAKMQESAELRSIPVIIVSGDESRETCLAAIRKGATDFITKPVDSDLLSIRVHSAISKAENERLRAKNSLLEVMNEERVRYDSALEDTGMTFVEFDWRTGEFSYYPSISKYLLGTYDKRPFWQILLSDMAADTKAVQKMQQLVHRIAEDKTQTVMTTRIQLKTPARELHSFRVTVRRIANEFEFTSKLIISLDDLDYEAR